MATRGESVRVEVEREALLSDALPTTETEENKPAPSLWAGFARILRETKTVRPQLAIGCVFLLAGSLAKNMLPLLAGRLLDAVARGQAGGLDAQKQLNTVVLQLVGAALATGLLSAVRSYLFNSASERVVAGIRSRLFHSLLRQELGFYDSITSGSLVSRISADTESLKDAGTTNVSILLRSFTDLVVALALMLATSWRLTLMALSVTPLTVLVVGNLGRKLRRLSKEARAAAADASSSAADCIGAMRTVKAFAREQAEARHFDASVDRTLALGLTSAMAGSLFMAFAITVMGCVLALVFWYGALQVLRQRMTLGSLQAFVLYAVGIAGAFGGISGVLVSTMTAIGASARVFELLDREPALSEHGTLRPFDGMHAISAELRAVWFAFPSRPDTWVLSDVSLFVPPGKTVALVGPSGAGKSTIAALLERFYEPQKGSVMLAGVPVGDVERVHLHTALGFVSQDPLLLARSLRDNIAFGVSEATDEQVVAAAKAANADVFIDAYADGYRTLVGERGVQLSGGQRQRIAIARALLTSPKLLILDESTSAQDAETEAAVVQALGHLMRGRSALVIAHRLSTVRDADELICLVAGRVEERGTHDALLSAGGVYASLVARQLESGADTVQH